RITLKAIPASIYAGRGWCPVVSQTDLDDTFGARSFLTYFAGEALMSVKGTLWQTVAGIDYFSPLMIGGPDLPAGPNVIAGDYSYFSAPTGTIGVGALNNPAVGVLDNPLQVNIQVLDITGPQSALPSGGTAAAGLTLNMGGASATTIDTEDGNGPRGVSGVIRGIVRPGTTAVTEVTPSPVVLEAPGYVFYDDTSTAYDGDCPGCNVSLFGPAAANAGLQQIWPEPVGKSFSLDLLRRILALGNANYPKIYAEFLKNYRFVSIDTATPHFYFYHPSTVSDYTAFDGIKLDEGAYNFIDGILNLKDDKGFNPYYSQEDPKKKKQPVA
ncbi:MAG: hypothetical protein PHV55_05905, partial [Candidatus Omnitrophica bacterium]|nr:hypothetical protein [Candidatus Omnitrophota bacterium]